MCGIALEFYKNNQDKSSANVALMLDAMKHRGQDQVSIEHYYNCVVGFRRLAITDLYASQPSFGTWRVYFNGEIYNYKELGFSGSECDIISQGLELEGADFIRKLNGMFFIVAIKFDKVYVFRDRYGIKPVYYFENEKKIIVASEIKALIKHPEYNFKINESAKKQWFVFNNVFSDETLFDGILKLDKGTFWHLNFNSKIKFWEWKFNPNENMDYEFAKKQIRILVERAIKKMIPRDVNYGIGLSGGVDSNIIGLILPESIPAYTVTYENEDSEIEMAKLSGRRLHKQIIFKDVYKLHQTIAALEDLRVGDSWCNYGLYEKVSEDGLKVFFDGAGADELFGGYSWRYEARNYYNIVCRTLLSDDFCKKLFNKIYPKDSIEKRFEFDANYFLEGVLLTVDKLSMAHTIEVRLPFLDNDLVDFCLTLPNEFKKDKLILKRAFSKYLHREIVNGKKKGFSTPDWLTGKGNRALKWANAAYDEWEKIYGAKNNKTEKLWIKILNFIRTTG